jgi:hypothetical protein
VQALPGGNVALPLEVRVARAPVAAGEVRARRGFDLMTPFEPVTVDVAGRALIHAEELDRVEVQLGSGPGELTGYMRVGAELGPLPIGSLLDAGTGTYGWQPGVGFVGRYDLVFVLTQQGRVIRRHEVTITLHPRGSNRVGPQVMIDYPEADIDVARRFTIAGWALDLDDVAGTGVETIHAWAYPIDSASGDRLVPTFLGVADYGGARPDVAKAFADRHLRSGYDLTVADLEPGTYDIAVFAWSSVRGGFVPARVVRVRVR